MADGVEQVGLAEADPPYRKSVVARRELGDAPAAAWAN
jgi:hypothetical protein